MTSTAYRQSSRKSPELAAADPRDELLGRFPFRRLDAEAIHDSILAIAGSLNLTMYGPASEVVVDPEGQVVAKDAPEHRRRGIYMLHRRSQPLTVIDTFDAPRMTINCVKRRGSTVASQALLMLNSEWILAQAERTAGRLRDEAGTDPARQVDLAYRLVFARHPVKNETERGPRVPGHPDPRRVPPANRLPSQPVPPGTPPPDLRSPTSAWYCSIPRNFFTLIDRQIVVEFGSSRSSHSESRLVLERSPPDDQIRTPGTPGRDASGSGTSAPASAARRWRRCWRKTSAPRTLTPRNGRRSGRTTSSPSLRTLPPRPAR